MSLFHFHEGLFDLPEGWCDQTMNVLRLAGQNGKKDAAILITRDAETTLEDPEEYADAQQQAAQKNFPGYRQIARETAVLDEQPAVMVDYQWRSNGSILLRQRQMYVRHQDKMLILTLSAKHDEFAPLEEAWRQILSTMKLLERETDTVVAAPALALPHVIALSTRTRALTVYADIQTLYAQMDPFEVEDEHWVFFRSDGAPMKVDFTQPNRRHLLRSRPGRFVLVSDTSGVSANLRDRLHGNHQVQGVAPLDTLDALRAHLAQCAAVDADTVAADREDTP